MIFSFFAATEPKPLTYCFKPMVRKIKFSFAALVFAMAGIVSYAQEALILDGFTGVAQPEQVQLRWVISSGETCNGTFIERSTDNINWIQIGDIPGVCGSSSAPVPYNFIDDSPVSNTVNLYRLELGGQGYSKTISVPYYDYTEKGYVLIPNPVYENTTVYFGTSVSEPFVISIFTISGQKIQQDSGAGGTYFINAQSLSAGTYLFVISRQGKKNVSGKMIIR